MNSFSVCRAVLPVLSRLLASTWTVRKINSRSSHPLCTTRCPGWMVGLMGFINSFVPLGGGVFLFFFRLNPAATLHHDTPGKLHHATALPDCTCHSTQVPIHTIDQRHSHLDGISLLMILKCFEKKNFPRDRERGQVMSWPWLRRRMGGRAALGRRSGMARDGGGGDWVVGGGLSAHQEARRDIGVKTSAGGE